MHIERSFPVCMLVAILVVHLVGDTFEYDLIDRILLSDCIHCLEDLPNSTRVTTLIIVKKVVEILHLSCHSAFLLHIKGCPFEFNHLLLLLVVFQLEVVKETHQLTLSWGQYHLAGKLVDPEPLDYV